MKYYQVISADWEIKGTYEKFETALANKSEGDIIKYFDGRIWIYNVTREPERPN